MWGWWRASERGGGADRGVVCGDRGGDVVFVADFREVGSVSDPEVARRVAIARAYLGSQPDVLAAIKARKEYSALLMHVSADVRDHYTAAVVQAVRSVLDGDAVLNAEPTL